MSTKTIKLYENHVAREEANRARLADDEPQAPLRHAQTFREPWGMPQPQDFRFQLQSAPSPDYAISEPCSCEESIALRRLCEDLRRDLRSTQLRLEGAGDANRLLVRDLAKARETLDAVERLLQREDH